MYATWLLPSTISFYFNSCTVVVEGEGTALWAGKREMELAAAEKHGGMGGMGRMERLGKMGRAGQKHELGLMSFWPRPAPPKEDMTVPQSREAIQILESNYSISLK
jgi:hypothetical protein